MAIEPKTELVAPTGEHVLSTVNKFIGFADYISPSYWLGEIFQAVCGLNPWEWAAQQVAGDWTEAAKAGDAMKKLAEFNSAYAEAISSQAKPLFAEDWSGIAAANASTYFNELTAKLTEQIDSLKAIGDQFQTLAVGMLEFADGLKSLLESLTDWGIIAAAAWAAAAASSWTIVGGLASAAAATAATYEAIKVWKMAIDAHAAAWTAVQLFTGLVAGYLGALHGVTLQALPNASYDHPGV